MSKKARKKKIEELREHFQEKLQASIRKRKSFSFTPPRYDDVFGKGQQWLDEVADAPITEEHGELLFEPDVADKLRGNTPS